MPLVQGFCSSTDEWVKVSGCGHLYSAVEPQQVECPSPLIGNGTKLMTLARYITPSARVGLLPNAHTVGDCGAVITADGHLILSTIYRVALPTLANPAWQHQPKPRHHVHIDGTVAVVTHHGSRNFAHVLADGMARIWLIRKVGIKPDAWVVPSDPPIWLDNLLNRAGITENRRIGVTTDSTVTASCLVVPDGSGFAHCTAPWTRTALIDLFDLHRLPAGKHQRVWISRQKARRRRWLQEPEVHQFLTSRGFTICHFEEQTIEEQLRMIIDCNVIAGPHGAGLAWALAVRRCGGVLIEICDDDLVHNEFRAIATLSGWAYSRTGDANVPVYHGDDSITDLDINPRQVLSSIDRTLTEWQQQH